MVPDFEKLATDDLCSISAVLRCEHRIGNTQVCHNFQALICSTIGCPSYQLFVWVRRIRTLSCEIGSKGVSARGLAMTPMKGRSLGIQDYKLNLVLFFSILAFHSHESASSPSLPALPMPLSTRRSLSVHRGCGSRSACNTSGRIPPARNTNRNRQWPDWVELTPSSCRPTLISSTPFNFSPSAAWTLFSVSLLSRKLGE